METDAPKTLRVDPRRADCLESFLFAAIELIRLINLIRINGVVHWDPQGFVVYRVWWHCTISFETKESALNKELTSEHSRVNDALHATIHEAITQRGSYGMEFIGFDQM